MVKVHLRDMWDADMQVEVRCRGEGAEGWQVAEKSTSWEHQDKLGKKGGWLWGRTGHRLTPPLRTGCQYIITFHPMVSNLPYCKSFLMYLPASSLVLSSIIKPTVWLFSQSTSSSAYSSHTVLIAVPWIYQHGVYACCSLCLEYTSPRIESQDLTQLLSSQ